MFDQIDPEEIRTWCRDARRILFITGAGISVDSGLPTYRGVAGLYDNANTEDGVPIEVALSGQMFRRNPDLTWKYLMQIATACEGKSCNRGHEIIAEFQNHFDEVWVATQNIDGFHHDAGSRNVLEIHGTMRRLSCLDCDCQLQISDLTSRQVPPVCPECSGFMRPDVVLFGEMLPEKTLATYQAQLQQGFDAIILVGTSALFPYISSPIQIFAGTDCLTMEINPGETDVSNTVDIRLQTGATEGLEQLLQLVRSASADHH